MSYQTPTLLLFIFCLFTQCTSTQPSASILGNWKMYKIIQDGKDVTSEHDPFQERTFTVNEDGTFQSDGRPFGKNTGKYQFNAEQMTLFLDSDSGPEDDSNWKVRLEGDTMRWQGVGTAWAEAFVIVQLKQ